LNKFFKAYGMLLTGLLALTTLAAPANAARYSIANYFPLPNAATNDEHVYQNDQGYISFERSGGIMAARTAPGLSNGPTVPASLIQGSDGYDQLFTLGATGLTDHGSMNNDPIYQQYDKTYNYDFITPPTTPTAPVASDFLPANLTTPSPLVPAVVDTAVKTVFNRNFARIDEFSDGFGHTFVQPAYVQETVTVDDNGGLLFDLTNPANPDYDPAFVAMWQTANGGSGVAHLKGLLKVTIQDASTGVAGMPIWNGNSTTVLYFASGVGVVYSYDTNGPGAPAFIRKLISYKVGAKTGAVGGLTSQLVKVQDPAGAALTTSSVSLSGPMVFDPLTGANVPNYTSVVFVEQTPGSGIFKLYYMKGDLVDLTLRGAGYADQTAAAQDLTALATASAPNPVPYTLTTLLGTISGKMLDAAGNPVANAQVSLSRQGTVVPGFGGNWTPPVVATTDINGNYSAKVDPAFSYSIFAGAGGPGVQPQSQLPVGSLGGSVTQTGQVITNQATQTPGSFTAASGATVLVNIQLAAGAVVSGKLRDVNGAPYANANINLQSSGGFGGSPYPAFAVTDVKGNYSITAAPGSYIVNVTPGWDQATGQPLPFPAGTVGGYVGSTGLLVPMNTAKTYVLTVATPTTINMQLIPGATISGQLLDANGVAYANANITVFDATGSGIGVSTDATGNYSIIVAPGTYTMNVSEGWDPVTGQRVPFPAGMMGGFAGPAGTLLVAQQNAAQTYVVASGSTTIVNMQLLKGAVISGTLTDANGVPYANAQIQLIDSASGNYGWASTDAAGSYSATVVPGSYTIQVSPGWDPATGSHVPFPAGMMGGFVGATGALGATMGGAQTFVLSVATPTILNMQLVQGAVVSGTVTDANGVGFANAQIQLFDQVSGSNGWASTDGTGHYSVTVTPGSYTVQVLPGWNPATGQQAPFPAGMMGGFAGPAGTLVAQQNAAQTYVVASGSTTVVNMQLLTGAIISGTLTDTNAAPYANAQIQIWDSTTGFSVNATTDAAGHYSITVTPGSYTVQVSPGWDPVTGQQVPFPAGMMGGYVGTTGVLTQQFSAAKSYTVTAGTTTAVNMQLIPPTMITGTLTDANGVPYANAQIQIWDSTAGFAASVATDATGNYSATLAPGSYTIRVLQGWDPVTGQQIPFPAGSVGGYVGPTGTLVAQQAAAKTYVVAAGTATVVNIQLMAGAVINGKLTDTNGVAYANASITAFDATGRGTAVSTDATGNYLITVAPGTYTINVSSGVFDPVTGQEIPFPAGMMGGDVGPTGALTQQFGAAKAFTVTAGATTVVNIQLLAGAVISGKLTDANGVPFANASITVWDFTAGNAYGGTTDAAGNYTITTLAGSFVVQVSPGWDSATGQPIPFPAGMAGGWLDTTGVLTQQFNLAAFKTYAVTVGTTTTVNMQLTRTRTVKNDFNGDGKSDVLIRNKVSHKWFMYNMNGTAIAGSGAANLSTDPKWVFQSTGDFNGDGKSDVLIRNTVSNKWYMYNMNGTAILSAGAANLSSDPKWVFQATGDFNGDGKSDVLIRNTVSNKWYMYNMNGTAILSAGAANLSSDPKWVFQATGDFNGDGKSDVLIRNTVSNKWYMYNMNGSAILSAGAANLSADPKWVFQATGDFNGDGKYDVLIRNTVSNKWYMYNMNGSAILSAGAANLSADPKWVFQATGDFNGDGKSDILIRNTVSNKWYMYNMNGSAILSAGAANLSTDPNWQGVSHGVQQAPIARVRNDFNGDGKSDVLIRNAVSNKWYMYNMNGNAMVSAGAANLSIDPNWVFQATGDFNGDGKSDVLIRNTVSNKWYMYNMNGTAIVSGGVANLSIDPNWVFQATGDFNGDGKSDILIRNAVSHKWYMYNMNGTAIVSGGVASLSVDPNWVFKATGDYNGDGKTDILIRNTVSKRWYMYNMNGTAIVSGGAANLSVDPNWVLLATGDFNGDGKADILIRNAVSHKWYMYNMNGNAIVSAGAASLSVDPNWVFKATGDYNGDGKTDILIRNTVSNGWYMYNMNGNAIVSGGAASLSVDPNWK